MPIAVAPKAAIHKCSKKNCFLKINIKTPVSEPIRHKPKTLEIGTLLKRDSRTSVFL